MEGSRERSGTIVKIALLVILVIVLVICVLDLISIRRERAHLADVMVGAAAAAQSAYGADHDLAAACEAARASVTSSDPGLAVGDHFCKPGKASGTVVLKLHEDAGTTLLGRIPYVRRVAIINERSGGDEGSP
jgi:hypothetical protein